MPPALYQHALAALLFIANYENKSRSVATRAPERKPGLAPCKLAWRQRKKAATGAAFLNVTDSNLWLLPLAKIGQIFTPFMYWLYGYSEKRFHRIWSRWNARMSS